MINMDDKLKFNNLVEDLKNLIEDMDSSLSEQEFNDLIDESGFDGMVDSIYKMVNVGFKEEDYYNGF